MHYQIAYSDIDGSRSRGRIPDLAGRRLRQGLRGRSARCCLARHGGVMSALGHQGRAALRERAGRQPIGNELVT